MIMRGDSDFLFTNGLVLEVAVKQIISNFAAVKVYPSAIFLIFNPSKEMN